MVGDQCVGHAIDCSCLICLVSLADASVMDSMASKHGFATYTVMAYVVNFRDVQMNNFDVTFQFSGMEIAD